MNKFKIYYGSGVTLIVALLKIYFSSLVYSINGNLEVVGLFFALSGAISATQSFAGWNPSEVILKYQKGSALSLSLFYKVVKVMALAYLATVIFLFGLSDVLVERSGYVVNYFFLFLVLAILLLLEYIWNLLASFATMNDMHRTVFSRRLVMAIMPIIGLLSFGNNIELTGILLMSILGSFSYSIYYLFFNFSTIRIGRGGSSEEPENLNKDIGVGYLSGMVKALSNKSETVILPLVLGTEVFGLMYILTSSYGIVLSISGPVKQVLSKHMYSQGKTLLRIRQILKVNLLLVIVMILGVVLMHVSHRLGIFELLRPLQSISYALSNWSLTSLFILPLLVLSKGTRWFVRPVAFFHDSSHSLRLNLIHGVLIGILFFVVSDPALFVVLLCTIELIVTIYWHLWLTRK